MGEAAPQAAGGMSAADISETQGLLQALYGDEYKFGYDPQQPHPWWSMKGGNIGSLHTADSPQELGREIDDPEGPGQW
jgi:hypothetical protein